MPDNQTDTVRLTVDQDGETCLLEVATRHVLWHFGDRTNAKADPQNRRNLALGFPRYVALMAQATDVDGGMTYLKGTVKR